MCKAPSSGLGAAPATCGPSQLEGENVVDACRLPKAEALPSLPSGSQLLCCLCRVFPVLSILGRQGRSTRAASAQNYCSISAALAPVLCLALFVYCCNCRW